MSPVIQKDFGNFCGEILSEENLVSKMSIPDLCYQIPQTKSNLILETNKNTIFTSNSCRNVHVIRIFKCFKTLLCMSYYTGCTPFKLVTSCNGGEVRHCFHINSFQRVTKL